MILPVHTHAHISANQAYEHAVRELHAKTTFIETMIWPA